MHFMPANLIQLEIYVKACGFWVIFAHCNIHQISNFDERTITCTGMQCISKASFSNKEFNDMDLMRANWIQLEIYLKICGFCVILAHFNIDQISNLIRDLLSVRACNAYQKLPLKTINPMICNSCMQTKYNNKYTLKYVDFG